MATYNVTIRSADGTETVVPCDGDTYILDAAEWGPSAHRTNRHRDGCWLRWSTRRTVPKYSIVVDVKELSF